MKVLDHLEEWLISLLMGAATLIIFVAVVHRYLSGFAVPDLQDWLLGLNFGWAQELCIIMFVWMAKFGAAYGVRTGIHVGVASSSRPSTWLWLWRGSSPVRTNPHVTCRKRRHIRYEPSGTAE